MKLKLFLAGNKSKNYALRGLRKLPQDLTDQLLCISDPARIFSVLKFSDFLKDNHKILFKKELNVAIISGLNEPEVYLLGENIITTKLCFEDDNEMWDLNKDWNNDKYKYLHESFDFVFCEQVLEHLSDPFRAFKNLNLLIKKGGFLHISTPGLNGVHTDPYYFYAGFHPRLFKKWAEIFSLEIKQCFFWGSPKAARMYSTCDWIPIVFSGGIQFFIPKLFSLIKKKKFRKAISYLKQYLNHKKNYLFQNMWSDEFITPVITVFLGKKI